MQTTHRDWLIAALRGSARWPPPASRDTGQTVAQVLAAADTEGVAAAVFHSLHNRACWSDLPEPLRQGLSRRATNAIAWELASEQTLRDAFGALAANGIDFLLLKGAALAHLLYPAPHLRTRCDTDLLFADREMADRAWHILRTLGYRKGIGVAGRYISHQFACSGPGPGGLATHLDIHWRLSNSNFFAQKVRFSDLWAERRPVPALGSNALALSARHSLIHAIFHRAWHLGEGTPDRLIWLYDIHLLCASFGPRAWDELIAEANRRGLQPICRDGLQDVSAALGTALPPDVLARLSTGPPPRFFGQMDLKRPGLRRRLAELMSLPTWAQRLGMVREHLFPDAAYMRERFGADAWWKLPVAYLSRTIKGLCKQLPL